MSETPLAAMGERVLRGGVCIVGVLPAVEGEVGVVGRSKPLLPQGLPRPFRHRKGQTAATADFFKAVMHVILSVIFRS